MHQVRIKQEGKMPWRRWEEAHGPVQKGLLPSVVSEGNKEAERKASCKSRYFLGEIGREGRLCGLPYGVSMRKRVEGPHCISQEGRSA